MEHGIHVKMQMQRECFLAWEEGPVVGLSELV
jgi:hypothetical protein